MPQSRGMPQRGYVLVFFCWALLAIITPTLVLWSASAKPGLSSPQGAGGEPKMSRRMLDCTMKKQLSKTEVDDAAAPVRAPAPAPAPASLSLTQAARWRWLKIETGGQRQVNWVRPS